MAAVRGRDAMIYVDGIDASDFLNEYEIESERDDIDVTPFNADSKRFLSGSSENTVTLTGYWDGDEDSLDEMLDSTFGTEGENIITICPAGVFSGKAVYLTPATQVRYAASAAADDVTEAEAEFRSDRVRGRILIDAVPFTATKTSDPWVDPRGATNRGLTAHVHMLDVTGTPTSVVVTVEGSEDGTTWAALLTFDSIITPKTGKKKSTLKTAAIPAQLRAKVTIVGGTTPVINAVVAVGRNR